MKHKGIAKKAGTFLITAILAAAFAVQTAAAVPAESEKAALTIQASSDGTGIAGVEWSVYQVAEMPQDGVFILTGDFAASGLDIDGLNDSSQSAMQKNAVKSDQKTFPTTLSILFSETALLFSEPGELPCRPPPPQWFLQLH